VGTKLFIFGGSDLNENFSDFVVFDTETMFWYKPQTYGITVGHHRAHSATLVGERLFVFGGGDGPNYFDTLYILDTKTMTWSQPEMSGGPGPRRAHTSTLIGKDLYIFGGGDGNKALNEVHVLDTDTFKWTKGNPGGSQKPGPRGYHTSNLVDDDTILVFGGSDGQECFSDIYTLSSNAWTKKKIVNPFPRLAHTATVVGPMLFVFGGHDGCDYIQELNALNLETMEWIKMPTTGTPPSPRGYHTTVLSDSRLFVFGGFDGEKCFDEMYILELGTLAYLPLEKVKLAK